MVCLQAGRFLIRPFGTRPSRCSIADPSAGQYRHGITRTKPHPEKGPVAIQVHYSQTRARITTYCGMQQFSQSRIGAGEQNYKLFSIISFYTYLQRTEVLHKTLLSEERLFRLVQGQPEDRQCVDWGPWRPCKYVVNISSRLFPSV